MPTTPITAFDQLKTGDIGYFTDKALLSRHRILSLDDMSVTAVSDGYQVVIADREFFIPKRHYNRYCDGLRFAADIIERIENKR